MMMMMHTTSTPFEKQLCLTGTNNGTLAKKVQFVGKGPRRRIATPRHQRSQRGDAGDDSYPLQPRNIPGYRHRPGPCGVRQELSRPFPSSLLADDILGTIMNHDGDRSFAGRQNLAASGYILVAACIWATVPLVINISGGTDNPFLFNAGWRVGGFAGIAVYLLVRYPDLITSPTVVKMILRSIIGWSILYGAIGKLEYGFLALSSQYVAISAVAIVYETWPVVMILCARLLFSDDSRYQKNIINILPYLVICVIGFSFIVYSENAGTNGTEFRLGGPAITGLVLAAIAAFLAGSHNAVILKWGTDLGHRLYRDQMTHESRASCVLFGLMVSNCVVQLFCIVPSFAIGLARSEQLTFTILAWTILGGILSVGVGGFFFRKANAISNNLGVNALSYSAPILALIWLASFSQFNWDNFNYVVIGASAIVTANLMINFEAEIRGGFKALILALGAGGVIIYLRDGIWKHIGIINWEWTAGISYFQALGLSATIFTLLFAFRVARLASRTREEDNRTFYLFRELDKLAARGVIPPQIKEDILTIDAAQGTELEQAYLSARECIIVALRCTTDRDDVAKLTTLESELDALTHSRQQGINFGEFFALYSFGLVTVLLAWATRPQVSGLTGLLTEVFAMLFSSVIVFLLANVWDLERERRATVLKATDAITEYLPGTSTNEMADIGPGSEINTARRNIATGHGVVFHDTQNRRWNQVISVGVAAAIFLAFAGLLAQKWLGMFG